MFVYDAVSLIWIQASSLSHNWSDRVPSQACRLAVTWRPQLEGHIYSLPANFGPPLRPSNPTIQWSSEVGRQSSAEFNNSWMPTFTSLYHLHGVSINRYLYIRALQSEGRGTPVCSLKFRVVSPNFPTIDVPYYFILFASNMCWLG